MTKHTAHTDRQRFEVTAKENGATILVSEQTILIVKSKNGQLLTLFKFTIDGRYIETIRSFI